MRWSAMLSVLAASGQGLYEQTRFGNKLACDTVRHPSISLHKTVSGHADFALAWSRARDTRSPDLLKISKKSALISKHLTMTTILSRQF